MKIKNLLLTGMCTLAMGTFAADQGTQMFYENFGYKGWHQGSDASTVGGDRLIANYDDATTAYKVDGNFYFPEAFYIQSNADPVQTYPGADPTSLPTMLWMSGDGIKEFNIKINTSSKPYASLSYAHSRNLWAANSSEVQAEYSFDKGATWTVFSRETANIVSDGTFDLIQPIENIGGKECVYIKIKHITGTALIDDIRVIGYDEVPVSKFALNGVISNATAFFNEAGLDPAYCLNDLFEFKNTAISAAQTVADNAEATQAEVDAAAATLTEALDAMKATKLDFTAINEAITAGNAKKEEAEYANYPAEDRTAMETALETAKNITTTGCVTQDDVNTAATTLNEAVEKLIFDGVDGTETTGIKLYPNPANDYIKIDGVEGETVYIVTVDGKTVKAINNYNGSTIGISNLTSGVYSVVVGDKTISFIKK